ncbi:MAG: hypothetical protein DRN15_07865 [Thermoprotei archaeon]|nr:MAG: hypothetical protein DRM97_06635 [Thermoprotei archaeon]RLF22853.1 MAG: hypothetical protein DRN15_07865 [Thermoprotei archaeon]
MKSQRELIYDYFKERKRLLIILDACRPDFLLNYLGVLDEFEVSFERVISSGSNTNEWLTRTFTEPMDVVYVTANPWSRVVLRDKSVFKALVDVSARFWDKELGTVRAEYVNLMALRYLLRGENIMVHYMQPHAPFVCKTWLRGTYTGPIAAAKTIYRLASRSLRARREFIRAYAKNLVYVLKVAKKLIRSALRFNYRIVLTSDHSELMGVYAPIKTLKRAPKDNIGRFMKRWVPYAIGYLWVVGHPSEWGGELLEVPWVEIKGFRRILGLELSH